MGYKIHSEWNGGKAWMHKMGTYIVFCKVQDAYLENQNTRQAKGLNHIAFMGANLEKLDLLQQELENRKIKILKRKNEYLCFEDPNEFAVEVYAKL